MSKMWDIYSGMRFRYPNDRREPPLVAAQTDLGLLEVVPMAAASPSVSPPPPPPPTFFCFIIVAVVVAAASTTAALMTPFPHIFHITTNLLSPRGGAVM